MITHAVRATLGFLLLFAVGAPQAWAETWHLNGCDTSLCNGVTGPFGTITTTLTSGKINVSVQMTTGYGLYGGTGGAAFGFNVAPGSSGVTISGISGGFTLGSTNAVEGGFGTFQYTINGSTVAGGALPSLAFTVNRTGGFTSTADVDVFSSGTASIIASYFAAHVARMGQTQAGYAAAGLHTPEPATLGLIATGLAGVLARRWVRRRRQNRGSCTR